MTKAPHLQGPRRDFTDPSGDLLAEGQYRPSGGEDQNAGRTICGEVLQARAPCRLLEPAISSRLLARKVIDHRDVRSSHPPLMSTPSVGATPGGSVFRCLSRLFGLFGLFD